MEPLMRIGSPALGDSRPEHFSGIGIAADSTERSAYHVGGDFLCFRSIRGS